MRSRPSTPPMPPTTSTTSLLSASPCRTPRCEEGAPGVGSASGRGAARWDGTRGRLRPWLLSWLLLGHQLAGVAGVGPERRAATVAELLAAIADPAVSTITLTSGVPYRFDASIADGDGPTALLLTRSLTLQAEAGGRAVLDAGASAAAPRRVLTVANGSAVSLIDVALTGGHSTRWGGGARVAAGCHLALTRGRVYGNVVSTTTSTAGGGGMEGSVGWGGSARVTGRQACVRASASASAFSACARAAAQGLHELQRARPAEPNPHSTSRHEVVATGSLVYTGSQQRQTISRISGERIRGPTVLLEDGHSAVSKSEAVMWAKLHPFSPLNTGKLLNPF